MMRRPLLVLATGVAFAIAAPALAQAGGTPRTLSRAEVKTIEQGQTLSARDAAALGWAYENGFGGLERDYEQALVCYEHASRESKGKIGKDLTTRLLAKIRDLAAKGDPEGMYALGMSYINERLTPPGGSASRLTAANDLIGKAADARHARAARHLLYVYSTGMHGPRDPKLELHWTRRLASLGSPIGFLNLARAYNNGSLVARDAAAALETYKKAAVQDMSTAPREEADAIRNARKELAGLYHHGVGTARDPATALAWYRRVEPRFVRTDIEKLLFQHPELAGQETGAAPFDSVAPAAAPAGAPTGRRFALVIGNANYTGQLGRLANAVNDAQLIAQGLRASGFEVDVVTDSDQRGMKEAFRRLGQKLSAAGGDATGLFYYAGHGVQADGVNYLVPTNAALQSEADLELEAVQADAVLTQMRNAGARISIMILDACRNMPLTRRTRAATRGLARVQMNGGSYIAYSTAPGETAADGTGSNSPFTLALSRQMLNKGQPIEVMFRKVRAEVADATKSAQTPWDSSSLAEDFLFVP